MPDFVARRPKRFPETLPPCTCGVVTQRVGKIDKERRIKTPFLFAPF